MHRLLIVSIALAIAIMVLGGAIYLKMQPPAPPTLDDAPATLEDAFPDERVSGPAAVVVFAMEPYLVESP